MLVGEQKEGKSSEENLDKLIDAMERVEDAPIVEEKKTSEESSLDESQKKEAELLSKIIDNILRGFGTKNPFTRLARFTAAAFFLIGLLFESSVVRTLISDLIKNKLWGTEDDKHYGEFLEAVFAKPKLTAIFFDVNNRLLRHSDQIVQGLSKILPLVFKQMDSPIFQYLNTDAFKKLFREFLAKNPEKVDQYVAILRQFFESAKESDLARTQLSEIIASKLLLSPREQADIKAKLAEVSDADLLNLFKDLKERKTDGLVKIFGNEESGEEEAVDEYGLRTFSLSDKEFNELTEHLNQSSIKGTEAINGAKQLFSESSELKEMFVEHIMPLVISEITAILSADPTSLSSYEATLVETLNNFGITKESFPALSDLLNQAFQEHPEVLESLITHFLQNNMQGVFDDVLELAPVIAKFPTVLKAIASVLEVSIGKKYPTLLQPLFILFNDPNFESKLKGVMTPELLTAYLDIARNFSRVTELRTKAIDTIVDSIVSSSDIKTTSVELEKLKVELDKLSNAQLSDMTTEDPDRQIRKQEVIKDFLALETVKELGVSWLNENSLSNMKFPEEIVPVLKEQLDLVGEIQKAAVLGAVSLLNDPDLLALKEYLVPTLLPMVPSVLASFPEINKGYPNFVPLIEAICHDEQVIGQFQVLLEDTQLQAFQSIIRNSINSSDLRFQIIEKVTDILAEGFSPSDREALKIELDKLTDYDLLAIVDADQAKQDAMFSILREFNISELLKAHAQQTGEPLTEEFLTAARKKLDTNLVSNKDKIPEVKDLIKSKAEMDDETAKQIAGVIRQFGSCGILIKVGSPVLGAIFNLMLAENLTSEEQKIRDQLQHVGFTPENCVIFKKYLNEGFFDLYQRLSANQQPLLNKALVDIFSGNPLKLLDGICEMADVLCTTPEGQALLQSYVWPMVMELSTLIFDPSHQPSKIEAPMLEALNDFGIDKPILILVGEIIKQDPKAVSSLVKDLIKKPFFGWVSEVIGTILVHGEEIGKTVYANPQSVTKLIQEIVAQIPGVKVLFEDFGIDSKLLEVIDIFAKSPENLELAQQLFDGLHKLLETDPRDPNAIKDLLVGAEKIIKDPEMVDFLKANSGFLIEAAKKIIPSVMKTTFEKYNRCVADKFLTEFNEMIKKDHPEGVPEDIASLFIKFQDIDILQKWANAQGINISSVTITRFEHEITVMKESVEKLITSNSEKLLSELPGILDIVFGYPNVISALRSVYDGTWSVRGLAGGAWSIKGLIPSITRIGTMFISFKVDNPFSAYENARSTLVLLNQKVNAPGISEKEKAELLDSIKKTEAELSGLGKELTEKTQTGLTERVVNLVLVELLGKDFEWVEEKRVVFDALRKEVGEKFNLMDLKDMFTSSDGTYDINKLNPKYHDAIKQLAAAHIEQAQLPSGAPKAPELQRAEKILISQAKYHLAKGVADLVFAKLFGSGGFGSRKEEYDVILQVVGKGLQGFDLAVLKDMFVVTEDGTYDVQKINSQYSPMIDILATEFLLSCERTAASQGRWSKLFAGGSGVQFMQEFKDKATGDAFISSLTNLAKIYSQLSPESKENFSKLIDDVTTKIKPKHYWMVPAIRASLANKYLSQIDKISLDKERRQEFVDKLAEGYNEALKGVDNPSQLKAELEKQERLLPSLTVSVKKEEIMSSP
jgi:hypothetical protein